MSTESGHPQSRDVGWYLAVATVAVLYVLTVPHVWQCEGVDEIEYLGLAHSMERGDGYTLYGAPYAIYPPLYPALVSVVMNYDVTAWRLMYMANALMGLGGLLYLASWLRKSAGTAGRWAAWFALFSYYPWSFSTRYLMAEPLYVLLSSVALVQVARCVEGERQGIRCAGGPLLVLFSAMTKATSIALTAALCLASVVRGLSTRRWKPVVLCAAIACAGFGFQAAWEWRAAHVDPNASETYLRWTLKFLGLSNEQDGIIAMDAGEGLEKNASFPVRATILGFKYGQYIVSAARVPGNFGPLAIFLWLVFLTGLVARARRDASSPLVWYTVLSLLMFCTTRWVSSYHRYLYVLTPLLYLFLLEGAVCWKRAMIDRERRTAWLTVAAFGIVGIWWTMAHGMAGGATGVERTYMIVVCVLCAVAYSAMAVGGLCACTGSLPLRRALPFKHALALLLVLFALHTAALAASRFRRTLANETLNERNLAGAVACGQWLKQHVPPTETVACSLPRLISFLADRTAVPANATPAGYVLLTGSLRNVPAFREQEEANLKAAVASMALTPVFSSGDAVVYKVAHP